MKQIRFGSRRRRVLALIVASATAFFAAGATAQPTDGSKPRLLIHVVTDMNKDDGPACVAFDVAWAALHAGYKVEMLFDVGAAFNIKRDNGLTAWDKYDIPQDIKELMAPQVGMAVEDMPKTYMDLLAYFKEQGMELTTNGTWMVLTHVEKDIHGKRAVHPLFEPLNMAEMVEHIARADRYVQY